jgi:hypothetical protein
MRRKGIPELSQLAYKGVPKNFRGQGQTSRLAVKEVTVMPRRIISTYKTCLRTKTKTKPNLSAEFELTPILALLSVN